MKGISWAVLLCLNLDFILLCKNPAAAWRRFCFEEESIKVQNEFLSFRCIVSGFEDHSTSYKTIEDISSTLHRLVEEESAEISKGVSLLSLYHFSFKLHSSKMLSGKSNCGK